MHKFCQLVSVPDYHSFQDICEAFLALNLKYKEIGMWGAEYLGVIFEGSCPSEEEISAMLAEQNIILNW